MVMPKIPPKTLFNVFLCIAGIFAFVLLAIYPLRQSSMVMDAEIANLNARIEEQKLLLPLFRDLTTRARFTLPEELVLPAREKLPRSKVNDLALLLRKVVQQNNFVVEKIVYDSTTLLEGAGHLKLNLVISGDFFALRDVLMDLLKISYIEHIEEVKISAHQTLKLVSLKLWVAQQ